MKTQIICLLSLSLFYSVTAQTIRRVNNTGVNGVNVYSTPQAAHDVAAANDILVIEPSSTAYADVTLTKPLKIYGNGYFLTVNTALKADERSSSIGNVNFNTGSGGSSIYGITSSAIGVYGVSNIIIQRCNSNEIILYSYNVANTTNTNISNIIISQNYIGGDVSVSANSSYTIANVLFTNNIVNNFFMHQDPIVQNWIVSNNTFLDPAGYSFGLDNSLLENNLIAGGGGNSSFTNVTSNYNVSLTNTFTGGTGNQNSYPVSANLVGSGTSISADAAYQIKAGSSLLTAGNGGSQVGAFGGSAPYIISGIAPIPSVVSMFNTPTGSNTTPLQVTISVKSNN